jgi:polar amino acid transport system substrate-binding protein
VAFVNGVLAQVRTDGQWTKSYNTWLSALGKAPTPPLAVYGRTR